MKGKALLVLTVVVFLSGTLAHADIFGTVDRSGGSSGDRPPVGVFDGDTDPLATEVGGLTNGNMVFSDRTYPFIDTPTFMDGMEYVRTFNTDKGSPEGDNVNYSVQILQSSNIFVTVDDRFGSDKQARVDSVTSDFASAGDFQDIGYNLTVDEGSDQRPLSIYMANLSPGTYNFGPSEGYNFYTIGAAPAVIPRTRYAPIAFTYSTITDSGEISGMLDARAAGGPAQLLFSAPMPTPATVDPNPGMTPAGAVGTITQATGSHNDQGKTVGIDWAGMGPVTLTGDDNGTIYTVDAELVFGPSGDSGYPNVGKGEVWGEDPNADYDADRGPDYNYEWDIKFSDDPAFGGDAVSTGGDDNPRFAVYLAVGQEAINGRSHRFTKNERQYNVGPDGQRTQADDSGNWSKLAAY